MKIITNKFIIVFLFVFGIIFLQTGKIEAVNFTIPGASGGELSVVFDINKETFSPTEEMKIYVNASHTTCSNTYISVKMKGSFVGSDGSILNNFDILSATLTPDSYLSGVVKQISQKVQSTPGDYILRVTTIADPFGGEPGLSEYTIDFPYTVAIADLKMDYISLNDLNVLSGRPSITFGFSNIGNMTVDYPVKHIYVEQASQENGIGTKVTLKGPTGENYASLFDPYEIKTDESKRVENLSFFTFQGTAGQAVSLRVCIDKTSSSDLFGVINESDETNNCSDWVNTKITLKPKVNIEINSPLGGPIGYNPELRWEAGFDKIDEIIPYPITSCKATAYDSFITRYSTPVVVGSWFGEKDFSKLVKVNGVLEYDILYEKIGPINNPGDYYFRLTCENKDGITSDTTRKKLTICKVDEVWNNITHKCETESTDPTEPTDPIDSTEPTDPTDPVEPVDSTDPTDPSSDNVPWIEANPTTVPFSGTTDLSWGLKSGTDSYCILSGGQFDPLGQSVLVRYEKKYKTHKTTNALKKETKFTLTCGANSASVTVKVLPPDFGWDEN